MLDTIVKDIADSVRETLNGFAKRLEDKYDLAIKSLNDRLDSLPEPKETDISDLVQRVDEAIKAIPTPQDGKSVTLDDVRPELQKMVDAIELPKPPSIEDIQPVIDAGLAEAVKALPAPDISELVNRVDDAIKAIPTAEQVALAMEGMFSKWALDFERKADGVLQRAVDKMPVPKDGKDGRDALDIEDFDISLADDGRTVTLSLKRGDDVVEKSVKLATILDRGVYSEDATYEKGDAVSYGGSLWISQKDAPEGKPGVGEDWRLAAKRGRDGKTINGKSTLADTVKI